MEDQLNRIAGDFGSVIIDASEGSVTGPFQAIAPATSGVEISALANSEGGDVLEDYGLHTPPPWDQNPLTPTRSDEEFQSVNVAAGAVVAYYSENAQ